MPTQTKRLFLALAVSLLGAGIYFSGVFAYLPTTANLPPPAAGEILIDGKIVCLPHIDTTGPQTTECAIGLQDVTGKYYGLRDSDPGYKNISGVASNTNVEIEGVFEPSNDKKYQSIGTIEVRSITPITLKDLQKSAND
jgi:hypothetical protein